MGNPNPPLGLAASVHSTYTSFARNDYEPLEFMNGAQSVKLVLPSMLELEYEWGLCWGSTAEILEGVLVLKEYESPGY